MQTHPCHLVCIKDILSLNSVDASDIVDGVPALRKRLFAKVFVLFDPKVST